MREALLLPSLLDGNTYLVCLNLSLQSGLELVAHNGTSLADHIVCYMEKVGQGMPGQSSKATATFARHCGHLDMALLALGIPTNTVTPNKWEKSYQIGLSTGLGKTEWKNRLKAKAQQLFPQLGKRVTLATCDALLLAEYGRKTEGLKG